MLRNSWALIRFTCISYIDSGNLKCMFLQRYAVEKASKAKYISGLSILILNTFFEFRILFIEHFWKLIFGVMIPFILREDFAADSFFRAPTITSNASLAMMLLNWETLYSGALPSFSRVSFFIKKFSHLSIWYIENKYVDYCATN